ncbi:MAG TPA: hypothetical protein VEV13_07105 [Candidatus Limnocylindria bacterium]|nr:hypothetical protein [Candidatus Limnocylindria bacterium]
MSRTQTDEVPPPRLELSPVSSSRRLLRLRAVAAALAVGGFASLGVVLLGEPSDATDGTAVTTVVESDAVASTSGPRPDIVLGAGA